MRKLGRPVVETCVQLGVAASVKGMGGVELPIRAWVTHAAHEEKLRLPEPALNEILN